MISARRTRRGRADGTGRCGGMKCVRGEWIRASAREGRAVAGGVVRAARDAARDAEKARFAESGATSPRWI